MRAANATSKGKIWTTNFIKLFTVAALVSLSMQFQSTSFPLYVQSIGGNLTMAGLMTGAYMGATALWKPAVGKLLNRTHHKKVLVFSAFIFASFCSSFGFVSIFSVLLLLRLCNSPFNSLCQASAATIATNIIPRERILEGLGFYNLTQTLSYAIGPALALALIDFGGYKTLFLVCGLFSFVAVLIALSIKYRPPAASDQAPAATLYKKSPSLEQSETISNRAAVWSAIVLFFVMLGSSGIVTYLPTFAKNYHIANVGLFFTVEAISLAISRLFISKVSNILGSSKTILTCNILIILCLIGITFSRSLLQLSILGFVFGLGFGAIYPALHSVAVLNSKPECLGSTNAMIQMANDGGIAVCSLSLGFIADLIGIEWVFLVGAGFSIVALVIYTIALYPHLAKK